MNHDVKAFLGEENSAANRDDPNILASSAAVQGEYEDRGHDVDPAHEDEQDAGNSVFGKKASIASTSLQPPSEMNPIGMRGSLNVGYRRHEMNRIN